MAQADRLTIAGGLPGPVLMENAGRAIADAIATRWIPRPVCVLCGPGNNGGDGFVVARWLAKWGWRVRLGLLGTRERLKGDAAHHAQLWQGEVLPLAEALAADTGLVVDAVFGAGLNQPIEGELRQVLESVACPLVAVDTPTGLDGNSGQVLGYAPKAALSVTFYRAKPGHWLYPGRSLCGELLVADIGIRDAHVLPKLAPQTWQNTPALWNLPGVSAASHKYTRGHCVVAAGAMAGASRLVALAALRAGAGLVTVATQQAESAPSPTGFAAAVIAHSAPDVPSFAKLAAEPRVTSLVLGPGAGADGRTRRRVLAAAATGKRLALDADAISAFAEAPEQLFQALSPGQAVLTPHEGEFRRLFPDISGEDKLARARAAATRANAVVLLKGPDTVIAAPDGHAVINTNAPPWLATAGSGDVLAGIVGGLLAQGMAPFEAACAAAWLHGEAGQLAGTGLIADDLPAALPQVLATLAAVAS